MQLPLMSICRGLARLVDIDFVGVISWTVPSQLHITSTLPPPVHARYSGPARVAPMMRRRSADLRVFRKQSVLLWRQARWRCPELTCVVGSWIQADPRIVVGDPRIADRATPLGCQQVVARGTNHRCSNRGWDR